MGSECVDMNLEYVKHAINFHAVGHGLEPYEGDGGAAWVLDDLLLTARAVTDDSTTIEWKRHGSWRFFRATREWRALAQHLVKDKILPEMPVEPVGLDRTEMRQAILEARADPPSGEAAVQQYRRLIRLDNPGLGDAEINAGWERRLRHVGSVSPETGEYTAEIDEQKRETLAAANEALNGFLDGLEASAGIELDTTQGVTRAGSVAAHDAQSEKKSERPRRPDPPAKYAKLKLWFDWREHCKKLGFKAELKDISDGSGYRYSYVKKKSSEYQQDLQQRTGPRQSQQG